MKIPKGCVAHLCVYPSKKFDCRDCHNYIDNVINEYEKVVIEAMREDNIETKEDMLNYLEEGTKAIANLTGEEL